MTLRTLLVPTASLFFGFVAVTGCTNDEELAKRVRALEERTSSHAPPHMLPSHAHPSLVMGVKGCKRRSLEPTQAQRVLIEQIVEKVCSVEAIFLDPDGAACPADYDIVVKWGVPVRLPDGGMSQLENTRVEVRGALAHPDGGGMLTSSSFPCPGPGYASEVWVVSAGGAVP